MGAASLNWRPPTSGTISGGGGHAAGASGRVVMLVSYEDHKGQGEIGRYARDGIWVGSGISMAVERSGKDGLVHGRTTGLAVEKPTGVVILTAGVDLKTSHDEIFTV